MLSVERRGRKLLFDDDGFASTPYVYSPILNKGELYEEAGDAIEVVSRLWDSWEDDAVIRDVPTGRYVDRDKLHPRGAQRLH